MKITGISAPFGLDLSQLDRDINDAAERLVAFSKSDAITAAQNLSLTAESTGPASGQDQTKGTGAGDGGALQANRMKGAVESGLAPLAQFGAKMTAQLDVIGGAMLTMFRRFDSAMKVPSAEKAVAGLKAKIETGIASASKKAAEDLTTVEKAVLKLGPAVSTAASAFLVFSKASSWLGSLGDVAKKPLSSMKKMDGVTMNTPAAGAGRLGGAFKAIDTPVQKVTASVKGLGREIALSLGAFALVSKTVEFFKDAVKGASDLGETLSKTEVRFGSATGEVVKFADTMARDFGLVKTETLDAAAGFGGLGKSLAGLTGNELAAFSTKMTQLAADMGSQENKGFKEMSDALKIGLAGNQSDVLREMGVIITEVNVKAYALAHGIGTVGKELTEADKVMARAGLIMSKTKDAQGDLARTADSTANQFRKAGGGLTNFATSVGELLLPAVNAGTAAFNGLLGTLIEVFEANKERIAAFANGIKAGFDLAGLVIKNFGVLWQITTLKAGAHIENLIRWFQVIPANLKVIGTFISENWTKVMFTAVDYVLTLFINLGTNLRNLASAVVAWFKDPTSGFKFEWTGLTEGFKSSLDKLPEMVKPVLADVQSQVDELTAKLKVPEAITKKLLPKPDDAGAGAGAKAKDAGAAKLAGLAEAGSKDAFTAIAKFQAGGAGKDDKAESARKTADETKKTAENTGAIARWCERMAPGSSAQLEVVGI